MTTLARDDRARERERKEEQDAYKSLHSLSSFSLKFTSRFFVIDPCVFAIVDRSCFIIVIIDEEATL